VQHALHPPALGGVTDWVGVTGREFSKVVHYQVEVILWPMPCRCSRAEEDGIDSLPSRHRYQAAGVIWLAQHNKFKFLKFSRGSQSLARTRHRVRKGLVEVASSSLALSQVQVQVQATMRRHGLLQLEEAGVEANLAEVEAEAEAEAEVEAEVEAEAEARAGA